MFHNNSEVQTKSETVSKKKTGLIESDREKFQKCSLYKYMGNVLNLEQNIVPKDEDPMMRREKFAESLRKKKHSVIFNKKRKKTFEFILKLQTGSNIETQGD